MVGRDARDRRFLLGMGYLLSSQEILDDRPQPLEEVGSVDEPAERDRPEQVDEEPQNQPDEVHGTSASAAMELNRRRPDRSYRAQPRHDTRPVWQRSSMRR